MREVVDYLDDILDAVEKIRRFTNGMDYEAFVEDEKTVDAVLRNFEVIGEAAKTFRTISVTSTVPYPGPRWPVCVTS
jgi:uncharacterized protein with HEPN domain